MGYKPDSDTIKAPPHKVPQVNKKVEIPNRSVAVDALKSGMMARFKNSFVAASSGGTTGSTFTSSPGQQVGQNAAQTRSSGGIGYGNGKGQTLSGFVSGGSIGGGMPQSQTKGSAASNLCDDSTAGYGV